MKNKTKLLWCLWVPAVFVVLLSSTPKAPAAGDPANGEQLYTANCAKCHGEKGEGFLKLYPPISDSRFLKEDIAGLPCIIRYGLKGKITVGTTTYDQIMPPIQWLSPEQISHTITFMQDKWNHPQTELAVDKWLESCNSK